MRVLLESLLPQRGRIIDSTFINRDLGMIAPSEQTFDCILLFVTNCRLT